jgi:hypothetical protein
VTGGKISITAGGDYWITTDTPRANRALLLEARPGEPMVFDLLAAARSSGNDGGDLAEKEFAGVVVVTQTCDCVFRPIVTAVSEMV